MREISDNATRSQRGSISFSSNITVPDGKAKLMHGKHRGVLLREVDAQKRIEFVGKLPSGRVLGVRTPAREWMDGPEVLDLVKQDKYK